MHVDRVGTGNRGELAAEVRVVRAGELRGLGIEGGRRRVAAVGQALHDVRRLADIGHAEHDQVLRAVRDKLFHEGDLIGDGIVHVVGLLLRGAHRAGHERIAHPARGVCQGIGCLAGSYDRRISAFDAATVGSENT
jgi:hypothetical protein